MSSERHDDIGSICIATTFCLFLLLVYRCNDVTLWDLNPRKVRDAALP